MGSLFVGLEDGCEHLHFRGVVDFLALLADWGQCDENCCLSDLNLDGFVGMIDFIILLANWTP